MKGTSATHSMRLYSTGVTSQREGSTGGGPGGDLRLALPREQCWALSEGQREAWRGRG